MEPLSPELVLVSPAEEVERARAALAPPPEIRFERPRARLRTLAALYAVCLLVTALPVALLVVAQR